MSFRSDAIQATEDIIDALGEPVVYKSKDGFVKTIEAIFEREYFESATDVAGSQTVLTAKSSDGPFAEGDSFLIEDISYQVVTPDSDEDGQTRILLEKISG